MPPPPGPDPDPGAARPDESAEFLDLVHTVLHAVRREASARCEPEGVTPGQLRFLRHLARAGAPRRPGELAAALDLAPRSVTSKVDQAEAEGLVERLPDPSDRRATLVALTPAGAALVARLAEHRHLGAQERLARLDEADRAHLLALLRRLAAPPSP
ncbi:MarR family winged helix-turn-helix transcriptional regulator [Cellulomonas endophytica]|uniref:MarR family winged helix-turn-helix transcriptional regulator n=1 Tax=Cellulomonas endophytica TaxID=2494735 RepID=UPI0010124317|nr:MarR family transcriptional regulator [Cellulomonas endophytica]